MNALTNPKLAAAILNALIADAKETVRLTVEEMPLGLGVHFEGAMLHLSDDEDMRAVNVYLYDEVEPAEWRVDCDDLNTGAVLAESEPMTVDSLNRALSWLLREEKSGDDLMCPICAAPQPGIPFCPTHS